MKADYTDIKLRCSGAIRWYDQNGVPRYADFHPNYCPNIYAKEVILMLIECQACGRKFKVEMHWHQTSGDMSISEAIKKDDLGYLHYGDPPRHKDDGVGRNCHSGDTMNSEAIKILQFWRKDKNLEWERVEKYEIRWEA